MRALPPHGPRREGAAFLVVLAALALGAPGCGKGGGPSGEPGPGGGLPSPASRAKRLRVRVGHFPNVTHAQGLIAHHFSREAQAGRRPRGWFEERLGDDVELSWYVYNAGPSAMEAVFTGALDLSYVGPSPALNAFVRSGGAEIRVVSGAASGGSALVVKRDAKIQGPEDFRGLRIGTPQLGNTQDVVCRAWLIDHGFRVTEAGGDVHVVPTANPDQLGLFLRGDLHGVWTVEPWVARLELEADGRVLVDDREAVTTVLVSSAKFLRERPEVVRKFVEAHKELTAWIEANPEEARKIVAEALAAETRTAVSPATIERAWTRLRFSSEIDVSSIESFLRLAQKVGFLKDAPPLSGLVEVPR